MTNVTTKPKTSEVYVTEKSEVKNEIAVLKKAIGERDQWIADTNWKHKAGGAAAATISTIGGAVMDVLSPAPGLGNTVLGAGIGAAMFVASEMRADKLTAGARSDQKIDREHLATIIDNSVGEREKYHAMGTELVDKGYQGILPIALQSPSKVLG